MTPFELQPSDIVEKITDSRMDITCMIEHGEPVPALFGTRDDLVAWASTKQLDVIPLFGKHGLDAVRVAGNLPLSKHNALLYVDLVWVRASWSGYRKALVQRSRISGYGKGLSNQVHADHVVSRGRLKNIPSAWVLLFEVPEHANSVFGSLIERHLPVLPATTRRYDLTGLEVFKLYCEAMPGTKVSTFEEALARVHTQFLPTNQYAQRFMVEMQHAIRPFFH